MVSSVSESFVHAFKVGIPLHSDHLEIHLSRNKSIKILMHI